MAFIHTVPFDEATGALAELYTAALRDSGAIDNGLRAFSLRPAAYAAWENLLVSIRSNMDLRRYELVTIVAAATLRCSYCALAHGAVLRSRFLSAEQVEAIVQDYRHAGLEPAEVAMLAYAEKVILHAYKVTPEDIDGLRAHGFSDADILDIALTAAVRSFYSKTLDAIGAEPDEKYLDIQPELRQALTVGRPFGEHSR
jgi:uncharacterized peroxidase-related enzyme